MNKVRRAIIGALGAAPFAVFGQRQRSEWPTRPVTIIVGFPPGQTTDIIARIFANELSRAFDQVFIVENKPGAGSTIAVGAVTSANTDGYTLLWGGSGNLGIAPYLFKYANYDPLKDLDPIAMGGYAPMFLTVRADSKFKTLADLLQAAKNTLLDYGSGGNGVTNHLGMELLRSMTGAKLNHIPYKGSVPAMTDLIGGRVELMFDSIPSTLPQIRSGRLRALAVSSAKRLPNFPDIPAVAEVLPGYECVAWTALCGPARTPQPVKDALSVKIIEAMKRPAVNDKLQALGNYVDASMTIVKTREWIASEGLKFKKIIKDANITVD